MTTSAYKPLTQVENAFKQIVWTPMVKAGEVWIEGAAPFLALPVVKELDEMAISALTNALFDWLTTLIDIDAIKLVNAEMQARWEQASESLSIIAEEQGVTSDAYKKALQDAAADFAHWVHTGP